MRRRQFSQERARQRTAEQQKRPLVLQLNSDYNVAVESALKRGYCPLCGAKVGRGVRLHFDKCGGLSERLHHNGDKDSR